MAEPDQDHEGSPAAAIIKGEDGFFRVRGQPESVYYSTEEQAERAARELLEAAGETETVGEETEEEQDRRLARELGDDDDGHQGGE